MYKTNTATVHNEVGDIKWSSGYDPENEICFVAVERMFKGKYKPIVYALKPAPDGRLYWAYLRMGHSRTSKKSAAIEGKQLAKKFGCEFEHVDISSPREIVLTDLETNVEVLGRITLLWETAARKFKCVK